MQGYTGAATSNQKWRWAADGAAGGAGECSCAPEGLTSTLRKGGPSALG